MKHLIWYISFFALLFAGDRALGWFLQKQTDESQFRYSRLYGGGAEADILLVGNSRGLTFYQPYIEEITGKTTFNLSYNGLPMYVAKALTMDYLDSYPAPKCIVVDITTCDRMNTELLTSFLTYAKHSPRLDAMIRDSVPKMWWGGQVLHLTRFNNEVFQRALFYKNKTDKDWLLDRVIADNLARDVRKNSYNLEEKSYAPLVHHLNELVQYAASKNVPVKLVISPYFPDFQVKNLDALKNAVEKATGLPVNDYRAALSDPTDFGDFMHPNKKGSKAYIELMKRDAVLP